MDKKSPDAFRTISEVAEWLGVPTHVLRFWESRFTQVKPVKRAGGRRYYRPSDMVLLGGIRKLLHEDGVTIRGVQKLLREQGVKHVAAMSPPIDSELQGDDTTSNIVTLDAARDTAAAPVTAAVSNLEAEDAANLKTPNTIAETPPDLSDGQNAEPAEADIAAVVAATNAPLQAREDSLTVDAQADPDAKETPSILPSDAAEAVPGSNASGSNIDPLEPIPHDGPTIAETLAANAATQEAIDTDTPNTTTANDLPSVTPDDVVVTIDPTPTTDGEVAMDLFSFADTTGSDTATARSADTSVALETSTEGEPSVIAGGGAETSPEPATKVEEAPLTSSDEPDREGQTPLPPIDAHSDTSAKLAAAPLDISHIPADPDVDQLPTPPECPSCAVRNARRDGTGAHLPVLQALADRLDALSVQMNRAGMS